MVFNKINLYKITIAIIFIIVFLIILSTKYIPEVNDIVNNIIDKLIQNYNSIYINTLNNIEEYTPKVIWAILTILSWALLAMIIYKFIMYLFKKFNLVDLIDKLNIEFSEHVDIETEDEIEKIKDDIDDIISKPKRLKLPEKLSEKIQIDKIIAKSLSYYVFLLFFRQAIIVIWIREVEDFLKQLIDYLPSLFVWFMIWFFWIRFANFIYDVIYHTLDLSWEKTAKIVAACWKIIVIFFTIMAVLYNVWIPNNVTDTILTWFIATLTIAWWIAFGLWWKDVAKEILEEFKK